MREESKWLGTTDVALLFRCSDARIRQLEIEGKLKAERTAGGRRIFHRDEVERLAQERARLAEEKQAAKAA